MAVTSIISVVKATASSLQKIFDISDIEFFAATEIRVYANSVELTSGFTTSVGGQTVTFTVGRTAGDLMVFQRDLPETQAITYTVQGKFPAASHEEGLDRAVMLNQERLEEISRCLQVPITQTAGTFDPITPDPGLAANQGNVLAFETDGTGFRTVVVTATDIATPLTTRGDLIRGGTAGAPERVALGATGSLLRSDGTDAVWFGLGTTGQVLSNDGTNLAWEDVIPRGTVMLFYQNAAPDGWTIVATQNNKALRVVSSAGGVAAGTNSFTTVMAQTTTGAHTLTESEIPSHTHTYTIYNGTDTDSVAEAFGDTGSTSFTPSTNATGGGGSHTHTMTMDIQYIDVILADRD